MLKKRIIKQPSSQSGGGAKQKRSNKKIVLTIFIILFLSVIISIAGAVVLNTLFGGESSKLLTFSQAGNQTDYIKLPESANVTSSAFNLTGLIYEVASLFQTLTQSDFDEGVYNDTLYNTTNNAVQLNLSYGSGNYTSKVLDTGWTSSYQNLTWHEQRIQCPEGMAYISKLNGFCIDKYTASVPGCDVIGGNCAMTGWAGYCAANCVPDSGAFGDTAGTGTTVNATSRAGVPPIVSISAHQARQMCLNAGKHLCTDEEWLASANVKGQIYNLPTGASGAYIPNNDASTTTNCNTNSFCTENPSYTSNRACLTGSRTDCHSSEGVYDMVGNVWEWTNETVDVTNPDGAGGIAGWRYINTTDMTWGPKDNSAVDDGTYGKDGCYFPTTAGGTGRAVIRGGYWPHGADAGPFCANLNLAPTLVSSSIGFRCCSS